MCLGIYRPIIIRGFLRCRIWSSHSRHGPCPGPPRSSREVRIRVPFFCSRFLLFWGGLLGDLALGGRFFLRCEAVAGTWPSSCWRSSGERGDLEPMPTPPPSSETKNHPPPPRKKRGKKRIALRTWGPQIALLGIQSPPIKGSMLLEEVPKERTSQRKAT